jgi:hypothetical protein
MHYAAEKNILRFGELLKTEDDAEKRKTLEQLIQQEQAKIASKPPMTVQRRT